MNNVTNTSHNKSEMSALKADISAHKDNRPIEEQFLEDFKVLVNKYDMGVSFYKKGNANLANGISTFTLQKSTKFPSELDWGDFVLYFWPNSKIKY